MGKQTFNKRFKKDNLMFMAIMGLWLLIVLYFDPKIFTNINEQVPILTYVLFMFCIVIKYILAVCSIPPDH